MLKYFIVFLIFTGNYHYFNANSISKKSTIIFLKNFLLVEDPQKCLDENILQNIYLNSFSIRNFLGNYTDCSAKKFSFYYYCIIKNGTYTANNFSNKDLVEVFPDGIYDNIFCFAMCMPNCLNITKNNFVTNFTTNVVNIELFPNSYSEFFQENNNNTMIIKYFNLTSLNEQFKLDDLISIIVLFSIILFFLFLGIFFSIFLNIEKFSKVINCCNKKNIENGNIRSNHDSHLINLNGEESNTENLNEKDKSNFYLYKIASAFDFKKSISRLIKHNHNKRSVHSKFINDDSLGFVNGLKCIIMLFMILSCFSWQTILSPFTFSSKKGDLFSSQKFAMQYMNFVIFYYLDYFFGLYFALHGFVLAYKFLFYKFRNTTQYSINSKSFIFIVKQLYLYIVYIFFFFLIANLDKIFYYGRNIEYKHGPLLFIYRQTSQKYIDSSAWFIIPIINFLFTSYETILSGSQSHYFMFKFINEIQYFVVSLFILNIYHNYRKKYLVFVFIIGVYFFAFFIKIILYLSLSGDKTMKFLLGFDVFEWKFESGFSIYYIGVLFGILYFEYNSLDISNSVSSNNSKDEIKIVTVYKPNEYYTRNFAKKLGLYENYYFFMLSFFILLLIFVYGYFYELDKIREFSSKIPFIIQFLYICEGDLIIFSVFLILFKFVFTKNSAFKVFLQKQLWVPISRSFYPIMFFVSPFASIILYDFNYSLSLGFTKLIFLFTSISMMSIAFGFVFMTIIQIPLKVLSKMLFKKYE